MKKDYRPWKTIAAELSQELDPQKVGALADELDAAMLAQSTPLHLQKNPYIRFQNCEWIHNLLASSLLIANADFGNVQLFDSSQSVLRIAAQRGFQKDFLNYFDTVSCDDDCACGSAMKSRSRIVVTDVGTDSIFGEGESRKVLLRANVRSVQSTPLVDSSGNFIGMLSTHFTDCVTPTADMLKGLDAVVSECFSGLPADPIPF